MTMQLVEQLSIISFIWVKLIMFKIIFHSSCNYRLFQNIMTLWWNLSPIYWWLTKISTHGTGFLILFRFGFIIFLPLISSILVSYFSWVMWVRLWDFVIHTSINGIRQFLATRKRVKTNQKGRLLGSRKSGVVDSIRYIKGVLFWGGGEGCTRACLFQLFFFPVVS